MRCCFIQFSHSVISQHAGPPCPTPTPRVQTHIHQVSDPIQPFRPLSSSSPSALNPSLPASGSFPMSQHFGCGGQSIVVSDSASVLPMNIQDWSPLRWTGWISLQSKEISRVISNITIQKHQCSVLSFLHSPTITSIHDHWKNHSLDETDLCWQSDISAFQYVI